MLYGITATVSRRTQLGQVITHQVPTFYLNSEVQGILNKDHAKVIAEEIVNPTKADMNVSIFVYQQP